MAYGYTLVVGDKVRTKDKSVYGVVVTPPEDGMVRVKWSSGRACYEMVTDLERL